MVVEKDPLKLPTQFLPDNTKPIEQKRYEQFQKPIITTKSEESILNELGLFNTRNNKNKNNKKNKIQNEIVNLQRKLQIRQNKKNKNLKNLKNTHIFPLIIHTLLLSHISYCSNLILFFYRVVFVVTKKN